MCMSEKWEPHSLFYRTRQSSYMWTLLEHIPASISSHSLQLTQTPRTVSRFYFHVYNTSVWIFYDFYSHGLWKNIKCMLFFPGIFPQIVIELYLISHVKYLMNFCLHIPHSFLYLHIFISRWGEERDNAFNTCAYILHTYIQICLNIRTHGSMFESVGKQDIAFEMKNVYIVLIERGRMGEDLTSK